MWKRKRLTQTRNRKRGQPNPQDQSPNKKEKTDLPTTEANQGGQVHPDPDAETRGRKLPTIEPGKQNDAAQPHLPEDAKAATLSSSSNKLGAFRQHYSTRAKNEESLLSRPARFNLPGFCGERSRNVSLEEFLGDPESATSDEDLNLALFTTRTHSSARARYLFSLIAQYLIAARPNPLTYVVSKH